MRRQKILENKYDMKRNYKFREKKKTDEKRIGIVSSDDDIISKFLHPLLNYFDYLMNAVAYFILFCDDVFFFCLGL